MKPPWSGTEPPDSRFISAIVWQDRRTADWCDELKAAGHEALVQSKTGLLLDPYFSALRRVGFWIGLRVLELGPKPGAGFGTVDSFVMWHLTQGRTHKIEATNAARTLLFNIDTQQWDDELLAIFKVPRAMLPDVCDSAGELAVVDASIWGTKFR